MEPFFVRHPGRRPPLSLVPTTGARLVSCITFVKGLRGFSLAWVRARMYTIKRASEMVGVPVATLRAWQRRYRVVEPRRSDSGYRLYDAADIAKLRSMQALVASGWSPKEAAAVVSDDSDLATEPDDLERDQTPPRSRSSLRASARTVDLVSAAAALDPSAVTQLLDERFATGSFEHVVDGWLLPELTD